MKRILSLIIVVILLFSVCSCKSKPETDEVGQIITENETPSTETDIEKENEETTEQTDKTPEPEPKPEPEPEQTDTDNEELYNIAINEHFSEYEVVVSLSCEETSKGKIYTINDFPNLDLLHVFEYDYFDKNAYPECKDKTTLMLMLSEPSKDKVIEYINILQNDSRIYMAYPNYFDLRDDCLNITLTYEYAKSVQHENYITDDFPHSELISSSYFIKNNKDGSVEVDIMLKQSGRKNIINIVKSLLKENVIQNIRLYYYNLITDSVFIKAVYEDNLNKTNYIPQDFPEIDIDSFSLNTVIDKSISPNEKPHVLLLANLKTHLKYHEILKTIKQLKSNPRVYDVEINTLVYARVNAN